MNYSYPASYPPYQSKNLLDTVKCENNINVNGKGIIRTQPDMAVITIGVITESKNLKEAEEENSVSINKIISALQQMGIREKDIKTDNFNINMEYDYIEGKQVFRGYKITNNLNVTVRDLSKIGDVINTSIANGANNIGNINFTISNVNLVYREAIRLACKDAKEKAEGIARNFGVAIYDVPCRVEEQGDNYGLANENAGFKAISAGTPIKSGEIEITAIVKAVFDYNIYS